jgi:uncharacterized protein (DUF58 family)
VDDWRIVARVFAIVVIVGIAGAVPRILGVPLGVDLVLMLIVGLIGFFALAIGRPPSN